MSAYNACELDAPSPRFAGLMRSWLYHAHTPGACLKRDVKVQCHTVLALYPHNRPVARKLKISAECKSLPLLRTYVTSHPVALLESHNVLE